MRFEWDEAKAASNWRKHRIRFEVASEVFDDPLRAMEQDRVEAGEMRWQAIGVDSTRRLLLVAHAYPEGADDVIRIVSARKATRQERRRYEQNG